MNWILILSVTISTVGILSWLKEGAKLLWPGGKVPSLVWWAAMPVVAIASGLVYDKAPGWVTIGIAALAFVQIAYENIIKLIQAKVDALRMSY